jgi:phenylpropionate dioxygenase-like ring-hydroxylating dioxygenase large terminal subunit
METHDTTFRFPKAWYVLGPRNLAPSASRAETKMTRLRRFGRDWILWRDARAGWILQEDRCAHRSAALSRGEIVRQGDSRCVRCPFHGYDFNAEGVCVHAPEIKRSAPGLKIETHPVVEAHDFFWVGWKMSKNECDATPPPWFEEIDRRYTYSHTKHLWPIHFSRSVESQLDYAHLPYVHARNIGRGFDPSRPVALEADGRRIRMTMDPVQNSYFELRMGNLWKLNITEKMKQVIAFVPVDERRTMLYLRTYHAFTALPVVRNIVAWILSPFNFYILKQDRDVVRTQTPHNVLWAHDERLMPSDRAIQAFRKWLTDAP